MEGIVEKQNIKPIVTLLNWNKFMEILKIGKKSLSMQKN